MSEKLKKQEKKAADEVSNCSPHPPSPCAKGWRKHRTAQVHLVGRAHFCNRPVAICQAKPEPLIL